MGFFSRLKWLLVGEGEAPSSFKSSAPHGRRPDSNSQRGPAQGRDRNHNGPRDRDGRDNRGDRYSRDGRDSSRAPRDSREPRDSRPPREPREPRERESQPRSSGYSRDGNGNNDRYAERDRGPQAPRRSGSQGNFSRRDSNSSEGNFPRPMDRPTGGPSSTMRPAQSSIQEVAPMPVIERPVPQGPERVGVVSSYLEDARMASIKMEKGYVRSGDWIEIQGNISSLRQKVDSIQFDNQPVAEAREGQDVSIRVIRPVKAGDVIVRLRG